MRWYELYIGYSTMTDDTLRSSVLSLNEIGSGSEVVDTITGIANAEIRIRLIEKAMALGAVFSEKDCARLDSYIPSFLLVKLAKYGNLEFGLPEEAASVIGGIADENVKRALYERANVEDIKFTPYQLELMGYDDIDSAHDRIGENEEEKKQIGCLGFLLLGWLLGCKKKRK